MRNSHLRDCRSLPTAFLFTTSYSRINESVWHRVAQATGPLVLQSGLAVPSLFLSPTQNSESSESSNKLSKECSQWQSLYIHNAPYYQTLCLLLCFRKSMMLQLIL